jgi:hypothetical protein
MAGQNGRKVEQFGFDLFVVSDRDHAKGIDACGARDPKLVAEDMREYYNRRLRLRAKGGRRRRRRDEGKRVFDDGDDR